MKTNFKLVNVPTIGVEYHYKNRAYAILRDDITHNYGLYEYSLNYDCYKHIGQYCKTIEECCLANQKILPESWFSKEEVMEHGDRFKLKRGSTIVNYGVIVETMKGSDCWKLTTSPVEFGCIFVRQPTLIEVKDKLVNLGMCLDVELDN